MAKKSTEVGASLETHWGSLQRSLGLLAEFRKTGEDGGKERERREGKRRRKCWGLNPLAQGG